MLKKTVATVLIIALTISCKKNDDKPVNPPGPDPQVVKDLSKKAKIDSISNVIKKWQLNNVVRDSVWNDSAGVSFFIKYPAGWFRINGNSIFPGATINTSEFKKDNVPEFLAGPENQQVKLFTGNITVKPVDSLIPLSQTAVSGLIQHWFGKSNGTTEGTAVGRAVSFDDYATLFLYSPAAALTNRLFDPVPLHQLIPAAKQSAIEKKNGCMVYSVWVNYRLYFDYQDGLVRYKNYYATDAGNKGFISMVAYGHEVFVFLESDAEEDKLRPAMNRTLSGTETSEDVALLKQSKAHVYYRHVAAAKVSKEDLNGYDRLKEYLTIINTPFDYKGVPLYYGVKNTAAETIEADRLLRIDFTLK